MRYSKAVGCRAKLLLTCTTFLAFCTILPCISLVQGINIKEGEAAKKELREKQKALKEELKSSKDSVRQESDRKTEIDKKIKIVEAQIDTSNKYIFKLETEMQDLEQNIEAIKRQMQKRIEILKESLRSIYVAGDTSAIDIILQAKTFEDFVDKSQLVKSVSNTISEIIGELNDDLERIKANKAEIEERKQEAQKEAEELSSNQQELQVLLDESEAILAELEASEQNIEDQLDENDEELQKIEREIEQYYEQQRILAERKRKEEEEAKKKKAKLAASNKASFDAAAAPVSTEVISEGAGLSWPVPGYHYISSGYYDRSHRASMHGAIDIAGHHIYGARVVSADDGEVMLVNSGGWGGGYGTYVIIDHGNGKSTLYAHLSGLNVHKGQAVKKGQVIGYVGNSGYSTGPHLHFETRLYGKKYNPMNEYSK